MALDFPSSPTNGQVFGNYTYDSTAGAWRSTALYSVGLPAGGTANQFLSKIDSTNYNTQWSTTLAKTGMPSGSILQVSTATSTTQSSSTSATYTNVPNLSVTITPTSSSSRFFLLATVDNGNGQSTGSWNYWAFARGGTGIGLPTGGSVFSPFALSRHFDNTNMLTTNFSYVDSPATTSAITYTVQWASYSSNTMYLNRRGIDTSFAGRSSLTVMEIA